jgi:uncharacterized protein
MQPPPDVSSDLEEIVRRITGRFSPEKIILFGSRACGDARDDSDIDLLVLFEEVEDDRARAVELYTELIGATKSAKDVLVSTTARFERYRNVVNTVYWPASREGRIIYDAA